jgi:glycerol-3-phosphate dehydrogenase
MGVHAGPWTRGALLPGGDLSAWIGPPVRPDTDFTRFVQAVAVRYPALPPALRHRYARAYGARIDLVVRPEGLGEEVAPGVFEAELVYLHDHEWARSAEDVLWRRSKLGLHLSADDRARVTRWCEARWPAAAAASVSP